MNYRFKRRGSHELKATHRNILEMLAERYPSRVVIKDTHLTVLEDQKLIELHSTHNNQAIISITDKGLSWLKK